MRVRLLTDIMVVRNDSRVRVGVKAIGIVSKEIRSSSSASVKYPVS